MTEAENRDACHAAFQRLDTAVTAEKVVNATKLKAFADAYKMTFSWDSVAALIQKLEALITDAANPAQTTLSQLVDDIIAVFKT